MMKRAGIEILIGIVLVFSLVILSVNIDGLSTEKRQLEVLYLPSGQFLKQVSLGYRNLVADILWFKTIQYYGGYRQGENDIKLFTHLVDVITDLDPQFAFAYLFGGLIIAEDLGHFDEGVAFIKKGIENNPTDWWLVFELGFLHYVNNENRDLEAAAHYFELASRLPGADEITKRFAAFVAARAGHVRTSIVMWDELSRTSGNPYIRELAREYIAKLEKQLEEETENEQ
jgi:tetratricopeptide (TPR) repeat protein